MWLCLHVITQVLLIFQTFAFASTSDTRSLKLKTTTIGCKDVLKSSVCARLKIKYGSVPVCKLNIFMKKLCERSCGICQASPPLNCTQTSYGCCWDNRTTKIDSEGSNCRACRDNYRQMCRRFKADCSSKNKIGSDIRKVCPKTCNLCKSKCQNLERRPNNCKRWARRGMCYTRRPLMKVLCKRTCKFC